MARRKLAYIQMVAQEWVLQCLAKDYNLCLKELIKNTWGPMMKVTEEWGR